MKLDYPGCPRSLTPGPRSRVAWLGVEHKPSRNSESRVHTTHVPLRTQDLANTSHQVLYRHDVLGDPGTVIRSTQLCSEDGSCPPRGRHSLSRPGLIPTSLVLTRHASRLQLLPPAPKCLTPLSAMWHTPPDRDVSAASRPFHVKHDLSLRTRRILPASTGCAEI